MSLSLGLDGVWLACLMNKWEKAEDKVEAEAHAWELDVAKRNFSAPALTPGSALKVCVLEAAGLPHTDWAPFKDMRPDPYVRITVFDEDGEGTDCHSKQANIYAPGTLVCGDCAL